MIPGIVASQQMIRRAINKFFANTGATWPWYAHGHYPPALYDAASGLTWVAWEAWDGLVRGIYVTSYDHASDFWGPITVAGLSPLVDDDHGTPAICLDHEGHLHVFYGSHISNQRHSSTRWPVTGPAGGGSLWAIHPELAGNYTYPHPSLVGSTLYLFLRSGDVSPWERYLVLRKTTALAAGVATWDTEKILVDFGADSRFYGGVHLVVGTDIHIVAARSDGADTERKGVYYFIYDTTDGSVRNFDGSEVVASGSLPIDLTLANSDFRLVDHGSNRGDTPGFCLDTNGDPHIVYADGTGTSFDLKHITNAGAGWSSPETVATVQGPAGIGTVEVVTLVPLAGGAVELWYPLDPGSDWDRGGDMTRRVRSAGGTWGDPQTILLANNYALGEPSQVRDGHPNARVIFCEHTQGPTTEAGDLRMFMWGETGFIPYQQAPADELVTADDGAELREDDSNELREDDTIELREVAV